MSPKYQNPALTVDAVWVHRGKVLLVRRDRPPFQGMYALPGGFVELRETVEEAVVRELREETGLVGRPLAIVGVYSGPDRDPRKPTTTVAFLIGGRVATPSPGDDAREAAWVPTKHAAPLAFDHARILRDALRRRRSRGLPGRRAAKAPPGRPRRRTP